MKPLSCRASPAGEHQPQVAVEQEDRCRGSVLTSSRRLQFTGRDRPRDCWCSATSHTSRSWRRNRRRPAGAVERIDGHLHAKYTAGRRSEGEFWFQLLAIAEPDGDRSAGHRRPATPLR